MQLNQINIRDFFDQPFIHGWKHAKKELTFNKYDHDSYDYFHQYDLCPLENRSNSLRNKCIHIGLTVLLLFPVINIITHISKVPLPL